MLALYVCLCDTCIPSTHGGQNRVWDFPETKVTDSCELSCVFWDFNQCPLKEQPVLLSAEPSFQLRVSDFLCHCTFFSSLILHG